MIRIFIVIAFLGLFGSCSKEDENTVKIVERNVIITTTETFEYFLGSISEGEEVEITSQANHFVLSQVKPLGEGSENMIYVYKALSDYSGDDSVEIIIKEGSDGLSPNTKTTVVTITFEVL